MSEMEKSIISKVVQAVPRMSEFDKGYLLGKVETLVDGESKDEKGYGKKDERDPGGN